MPLCSLFYSDCNWSVVLRLMAQANLFLHCRGLERSSAHRLQKNFTCSVTTPTSQSFGPLVFSTVPPLVVSVCLSGFWQSLVPLRRFIVLWSGQFHAMLLPLLLKCLQQYYTHFSPKILGIISKSYCGSSQDR